VWKNHNENRAPLNSQVKTYDGVESVRAMSRLIKLPRDKDMIQIEMNGELFALDIKELEFFVKRKGRRLSERG
jgi:hypothetical protein